MPLSVCVALTQVQVVCRCRAGSVGDEARGAVLLAACLPPAAYKSTKSPLSGCGLCGSIRLEAGGTFCSHSQVKFDFTARHGATEAGEACVKARGGRTYTL
eukprot:3805101-Prymnesium_polylepis.1